MPRALRITLAVASGLATLYLGLQALLLSEWRHVTVATTYDLAAIGRSFVAFRATTVDVPKGEFLGRFLEYSRRELGNRLSLKDPWIRPYEFQILSTEEAYSRFSGPCPPGFGISPVQGLTALHLAVWSKGADGRTDASWQCGVVAAFHPAADDIVFIDASPLQEPEEFLRNPTHPFALYRSWLGRPNGGA